MQEAILQAVKRAMPGHGRARIHEKLLTILSINDQSEVEVSTESGQIITLSVFSDTLVEEGTIRISGDDLKKLGIPEGGKVTVRRKIPLDEQIKNAAGATADQIRSGADQIGVKAKEFSEKVREDTKPLTDKVSKAVKTSSDVIKEKLPFGVLPKEVEKAISDLPSSDAKKIKSELIKSEKESAVVKVHLGSDRSIGNLTLHPEASIAGLQRDGKLIEITPETTLKEGDIVYVTGSQDGLSYMSRMLEE
jgi:K+/H+ antiporter YhaU regulatory subunit KhtT